MSKGTRCIQLIDLILALVWAGIVFLFYYVTLTPSLSYLSPDGNELATIPYILGLAHMPGYPLYTWLGKLFTWIPIADVAFRMNLMSATFGALGVGGLYLIIVALLHLKVNRCLVSRAGASLATMMFGFSPTFWSQSVIAEVYAPNIALVVLTLLVLLRWEATRNDRDFFFFSLVFGLSLGTHISNLGFAPAFAVFVLLTDWKVIKRPTWWFAGLAGFGLGVLQFAWLPLKANTLNDRIMLERAPTTLKGIYDYTLGSFPQFKFAFPLSALPDRVVLYLYLLTQQFGRLSLLIGIIGLIALLFRQPRYYFLLIGMYLIHVWFFIQYRAFDLEVFFLPAHMLWAIFLGFGLVEILIRLENLIRRISKVRSASTPSWALTIPILALALIPLQANLTSSDHSFDVAINDFYANVWEIIPSNATLLTQSGVFGYDAFYWRLVYGTRPDVSIPALPSPNPSREDFEGRELFSTTALRGQTRARGPGALPPDLLDEDLWQVPVLVGVQTTSGGLISRDRLTLYHISQTPPELIVADAAPEYQMDIDFGGLTLLGLDLDSQTVESGGRIHLILYWRIDQPDLYQVETSLEDQSLEIHGLGFGNLERYLNETGSNGIVMEDYWLVIPSTIPSGTQELNIRLVGQTKPSTLLELTVLDEEEAMERWLRIAGR